jgi:SAM-dependent methyltransferase
MRSQLKLIKKQYDIAVPKWEEKFNKRRYKKRAMSLMAEENTGYQITPYCYLEDIIRVLYKEFGVKPEHFKNMSLIDLGCGYGGMLRILYPYFKRVSGVEYNKVFVSFGKELFNDKIDILQGDVRNIICSEDIIYTFNITHDKRIFIPILENMKPGQIFIESYDSNTIGRYAEALRFSKIKPVRYSGVIVQK